MYGGLASFISVTGLLFAGYLVLQALLGMARRHSFDAEQVNSFYLFSVPLIENGDPAPALFVWAMVFGVIGLIGAIFLSKARGITREIKETEAEVSRRVRVEESLRKKGLTQAR